MKPFDLEKALAGEALVTRAGDKVLRFIREPNFKGCACKNFVITKNDFFAVNDTGKYWGISSPCSADLFMAPVERKLYANLYRDNGDSFYLGSTTADKAEADRWADGSSGFVTQVTAVWEE
jgi:hypothetical protein